MNDSLYRFPRTLMSDLQMDRILSERAIEILPAPCDGELRQARLDTFFALEDPTRIARVEECLSALIRLQRTLELCGSAQTEMERNSLEQARLQTYVGACEALSSLTDCGLRLAVVSADFSRAERVAVLAEMRADQARLAALSEAMQVNLLSISDKVWVTPNREAVSECDRVAACIKAMGLEPMRICARSVRSDATLADAVCRLFAEETAQISRICQMRTAFDWEEPTSYIPELKFYLEICALLAKAHACGIPHCIPATASMPQYTARELYDISLFGKECERIIPNDVSLTAHEPFSFLIGANGGGKTTYLRAVGLNLVLFCAGCPVFAREATMYPFARIFSHFPRDERFEQVGRLDEERLRVEQMQSEADGHETFWLFNETFSGTDDARGFALVCQTLEQIEKAGHFGLYVTHFHEVMQLDAPVLSAEVNLTDENKRTYRICKAKGNTSSYAADILRKYRLDRLSLQERREHGGH